jgi:hypothetical protein
MVLDLGSSNRLQSLLCEVEVSEGQEGGEPSCRTTVIQELGHWNIDAGVGSHCADKFRPPKINKLGRKPYRIIYDLNGVEKRGSNPLEPPKQDFPWLLRRYL